jgi:hypothetical protein
MNRRVLDRPRDAAAMSPGASRLLVLGFLIAGFLGLAAGLGWMAWTLLARWLGV